MRDWKKRFILAGILFLISMIILVARIISYKEEAGQMSEGIVASDPGELQSAMENDGIVYAKGIISGSLNMDEVSLNDGVLSADPDDMRSGQEPSFSGKYLGLKAKVGKYEYDKSKYESKRILEHHFYAKDEYFIQADTLRILDMEIDIRESKNLFRKMGALLQRVGDGSFRYDPDTKTKLPVFEHPDEYYYNGFELYAYPSEVEGALKLVIQEGEVVAEETLIIPASELEIIEDLAETGTMDYGTEIGAFIILWIVLTLIGWGIMKFLGY